MQSVIFDFNGTLFFDTELHVIAWKAFIKEKMGYEMSDDEFKERIYGRDNIQVIKNYFPNLSQEEAEEYSEEKEKMYRLMCQKQPEMTHLVEGAEAFFDYLKAHKIPFTIATGANKGNVDYYFEVFDLGKWFKYDQVVLDDGHLPGKPDPTVYLLALEKLGVDPKGCLVFEDSPAGVQAAYAAGIERVVNVQKGHEFMYPVLGIISDYHDAQRFLDSSFD